MVPGYRTEITSRDFRICVTAYLCTSQRCRLHVGSRREAAPCTGPPLTRLAPSRFTAEEPVRRQDGPCNPIIAARPGIVHMAATRHNSTSLQGRSRGGGHQGQSPLGPVGPLLWPVIPLLPVGPSGEQTTKRYPVVCRGSWGNAEAGAKPKIAIAPTWQVMVAICPWWFEALVYTSNIC